MTTGARLALSFNVRAQRSVLTLGFVAALLTACATEVDDEAPAEATADELQSSPLPDGEMKAIPTPAGMPKPWDQPDSTGWFDERGKCGPTAVANVLKLYGINVSPDEADRDGVHWIVGSRGINVEGYFDAKFPNLHCSLEHPEDGPAFLRSQIKSGHPVMVWFNTGGSFLSSHWVTAVGLQGTGASERVVVMSWGRYYTISMSKLDAAWRNVYLIRRPSVVCTPKSTFVR